MNRRDFPEFTSHLGTVPAVLAMLWLPIHVIGLPWLLYRVFGVNDDVQINFLTYVVGAVFMLVIGFRFLRRDFDALCDHPGRIFFQVLSCYAAMMLMNLAVSGILMLFMDATENPNNAAVMEMANGNQGPMNTIAIFLAPFVEEMIFRAAIFGTIRRRNRLLAYVVCIALFSIYHVWGYALDDPMSWLFLLQYLPASYLLCRCYEYCDSIWGSLAFHMLTNFISLQALSLAEELL